MAEAIFNSKIGYDISLYLNPVYEEEELKLKKLSKSATLLQTLQNTMIRTILGIDKKKHINMESIIKEIEMLLVN